MSTWPELVALLRRALAETPPERRIVACSGGLDSSVLMALLARLHADDGLPAPRALHVHHGLHPDADLWSAATVAHCRERGVGCQVMRLTVQRSDAGLEADARQARYAAFEAALGEGETLLLAQHRDDQVETLLLRLLRGAGPAGLAGMPAKRRLGRGWLLRPLLQVDRRQLEGAARELGVVVSEDPSNAEVKQDRNFLRHVVLPLLADRWPGYRQTASRAAELCREQQEALAALLGPAPEVLPVTALLESPALAAVRLRHWLAAAGVTLPSRARLHEVLLQARAREDAAVRVDFGAVSVRRFAAALHLVDNLRPAVPREAVPLTPPASLEWPHGRLTATAVDGGGLRDAKSGFEVRFRRGGERMRPAGRRGTRGLKDLLQEAAVPPWERDRLPLLYAGSELVAVADLYIAEGWQSATTEPGWRLSWQPSAARHAVIL